MTETYFRGPFAAMCELFVKQRRIAGALYESRAKVLRHFDNFCKDFDIVNYEITESIMGAYSIRRPNEADNTRLERLSTVRSFAQFLANQGYQSYILPELPKRCSKHIPYIFTKDEIKRIFEYVDNLKPSKVSTGDLMFPFLFRILYGCGLRISEAASLLKSDVDTENGVLRIRHGKNDNERLVPMSDSLFERCRHFLAEVHAKTPDDMPLFYTKTNESYSKATIRVRFRTLLWDIGIPYRGKGEGPRLHDLRHTFLCHNIQHWAESGIPISSKIPVLSKYVGHMSVSATQWYLRLSSEVYPHIREICERELSGVYLAISDFVRSEYDE